MYSYLADDNVDGTQYWTMFSVGGGTTEDLSAISVTTDGVTVKAKTGLPFFGGRHIDSALGNFVIERFCSSSSNSVGVSEISECNVRLTGLHWLIKIMQ